MTFEVRNSNLRVCRRVADRRLRLSAVRGGGVFPLLYALFLFLSPMVQGSDQDEHSGEPSRAVPPYPAGEVIEEVSFDFETVRTFGEGSDQWPMTWSGDGHIYGAWGDGWGFGGTGSGPKRSIGVTRIIGHPPDLKGEDLWGDGPGRGFGKPEALIALGDTLYMFWTRGDSKFRHPTATAVSRDNGVTWNYGEGKAFPDAPEGFRVRGICQFGAGYEGSLDEYLYVYFGFNRADELYLGRVGKQGLFEPDRYEWFVRRNVDGTAEWSDEFEDRRAVFHDANGYVWHVGISYVPGLNRFLLTKPHYAPGDDRDAVRVSESGIASFGMFDAPTPWGPWTTVMYEDQFRDELVKFSYFVPTKFLSKDGKTFWLAWSGWPEYDSVSFVKGAFRLRRPGSVGVAE